MKSIQLTANDDGEFSVSHDFGYAGGNSSPLDWNGAVAETVRLIGELGRHPAENAKIDGIAA